MATRRWWFGALAGVAGIALVSCGGGDGGSSGITMVWPDADIDAMEPCKGAASYTPGAFEADLQSAEDYPASGSGADLVPHNIFFTAPLDTDDPGDYLMLDLYEQYGAFDGSDIVPGVYTLTDDDKAYSTCGLCIMVAANATETDFDDWYVASIGTLTLASTVGRLTGSIADVRLLRVRTDPQTGLPSDSPTFDCETEIASASFDVDLVPGQTARGVRAGSDRRRATPPRPRR